MSLNHSRRGVRIETHLKPEKSSQEGITPAGECVLKHPQTDVLCVLPNHSRRGVRIETKCSFDSAFGGITPAGECVLKQVASVPFIEDERITPAGECVLKPSPGRLFVTL